ncbi:MAG: hypothetical protein KJP04_01370, partial [Arenicella sp.]|nr:hypothetical protein [Arenicella sp.]
KQWGVKDGQFVLCFSGVCHLSTGIDLALDALDARQDLALVTQPVQVDGLTRFLIARTRNAERIFLQNQRLSWDEAWSTAAAADVGVAIYRSQSPQFQHMGISSNRLCMFLAMGVPVIVSKQPSFNFVNDFKCGIQVETQDEFNEALATILSDLDSYKANALRCAAEYIDAAGCYKNLRGSLSQVLAR